MKVITLEQRIDQLLSRGVEDILVKDNLKKKLLSGKVLRVKMGIDPTGPKIHLGRAATLRKLKEFQDLGHKIVLIVGDFTARIGDASDKLEKRPMLTTGEIKKNLAGYKVQLGKIIDLKKAEFHYNSKWLSKLGFAEISELAESFSVNQMSSRRNFKERFDRGEEVSLREFMYPLMQGYDSVAVKADVEIGGFDQLFNLKAGRVIQKHYGLPEQDILTVKMIYGTDGRKMSTSWGNVITIVDEPKDMFGKIMSMRDELIADYFTLCTSLSEDMIAEKLALGPLAAKKELAYTIVSLYHGNKLAEEAKKNFETAFQKGEVPTDLDEVKVNEGEPIMDALVRSKMVASKSDFRRLLLEGAITDLDKGEKINDPHFVPVKNQRLKIGKKRFVKITIKFKNRG